MIREKQQISQSNCKIILSYITAVIDREPQAFSLAVKTPCLISKGIVSIPNSSSCLQIHTP